MTKFLKILGGHGPFGYPLARIMINGKKNVRALHVFGREARPHFFTPELDPS